MGSLLFFELPPRNQSLCLLARQMPKIIKEMSQTAWQKEQERIEALKARLAAEDIERELLAKRNLEEATIAFETAEMGEAKWLAERVLFRAKICEQEMRERKTGVTADMKCSCGFVKGRGHSCLFCDRWKCALYGGERWIKYGYCSSPYYSSPHASYYHDPQYIFQNASYYGFKC